MIRQEDILSTGNLELLAKKAVEGFITGFHKSPFHGFSVEFAEHRQYNTGESIRNIDWKLYGRTDKLFTKRFEEETNLRCRILIDSSSSMMQQGGTLNKFQYSIWCAAVFLTLLKKQRDAAGLSFFDSKVIEQTGISSSIKHYKGLMSILDRYLNQKMDTAVSDIAPVLHDIAEQVHRRSMIVLFTDLLEKGREKERLFDALQHLKYNKHEVIVFNTLHVPTELEFEFGNRPVTFEDLESGEKLRVQPTEIRETYVARIENYLKEIRLKMSQYKIDFTVADTSKGVEHSVIPFLVKRSKMTR
ncbi:DUF58 domain-containing protein [bacterium]|nr:DUF58 domain-containing protein [bacterium]